MDFAFPLLEISSFNQSHLALYFIFLLDICVSFKTGYYYRGMLIMTRKDILEFYWKNEFWHEILTAMPVIIIGLIDTTENTLVRLGKYVFLLRILYLDKMLRKIWDFSSSSEKVNYFLDLFKMIIWIFFMAHNIACMFKIFEETLEKTDDNISIFDQYLNVLYWAFATMLTIGYGDFVPKSKNEKILNILAMGITCCVFMSIMNKIGEIIDQIKNRDNFLPEKIVVVNKYFDQKTNDISLKHRIRKYLEYVFEEKQRLLQEGHEIVNNLSNSLKMEIYQIINSEIIENMAILKRNFSWSFLSILTTSMVEVSYTPEDFILIVFFFFLIYNKKIK